MRCTNYNSNALFSILFTCKHNQNSVFKLPQQQQYPKLIPLGWVDYMDQSTALTDLMKSNNHMPMIWEVRNFYFILICPASIYKYNKNLLIVCINSAHRSRTKTKKSISLQHKKKKEMDCHHYKHQIDAKIELMDIYTCLK